VATAEPTPNSVATRLRSMTWDMSWPSRGSWLTTTRSSTHWARSSLPPKASTHCRRLPSSDEPMASRPTLRNTYLRNVLETGLIVTYARPFTKGVGHGFPLSGKRFVPADKRELHRKMLQLRKKVHAHMDAAAPEGFQRSVTREEEPGVSRVRLHGRGTSAPTSFEKLPSLPTK
jgi:hypothetical protein